MVSSEIEGSAQTSLKGEMPKVSIIIPVYNDKKRVGRAIESALTQTLKQVEVIVVDDGSTDGTENAVKSFGGRVVSLRQENKGPAAARNAGIEVCDGKYVCFLDSDDLLMPTKAELQVSIMEKNPEIGLCYGATLFMDEEGRKIGKKPARLPKEGWLELLPVGCPFTPNSPMIRREWLEKVGGFDERLTAGEDWDLWCRLWLAGCAFHPIDEIVATYRIRPGTQSRDCERLFRGRTLVLDKLFAALGPRASEALRNKAYCRIWYEVGAERLRLGQEEPARRAWQEAIRFRPDVFEDKLTWDQAVWRQDPSYPLHHPDGLPDYKQVWDRLSSGLTRLCQEEWPTGFERRLRPALGTLALSLSDLAFSRRKGLVARRWWLKALSMRPRLLLSVSLWRSAMKKLIGPWLTLFVQRIAAYARKTRKRPDEAPNQREDVDIA